MGLTIGRLARQVGINVETIRYYQRRGLIEQPGKPESGYRQYDDRCLGRLQFIRNAKQLGFSLDEIGQLLDLSEGRCEDVRSLASQRLVGIESSLRKLERLQQSLLALIRRCDENPDLRHCPIIESLGDDNPSD